MTDRGGAEQKSQNVTTLINETATAAAIRLSLRRAAEQVHRGDKFFLFIAAHGIALDHDEGFIAAYDSRVDVRASMLPMTEIAQALTDIQSMGVQVFVFADVCHAGLIANYNFANRRLKTLFGDVSGLLASGTNNLRWRKPACRAMRTTLTVCSVTIWSRCFPRSKRGNHSVGTERPDAAYRHRHPY